MACEKHPTYKGLRLSKKAKQCSDCMKFYEENKANGVKENRGKKVEPTHKTDNTPKTNEQNLENISLDIDNDKEEIISNEEEKTEEGNTENKEDKEGCDCDVDDKIFDDIFEELDIDESAEIDSDFEEDDDFEDDDDDDDIGDLEF